jgi:hypothetical protein
LFVRVGRAVRAREELALDVFVFSTGLELAEVAFVDSAPESCCDFLGELGLPSPVDFDKSSIEQIVLSAPTMKEMRLWRCSSAPRQRRRRSCSERNRAEQLGVRWRALII